MKKLNYTIWAVTLITLLTFNQCSNEIFQFVLPIPFEVAFTIDDDDGEWEEVATVEFLDFVGILDEIGDETTIEAVLVEGVVLLLEGQDPGLSGVEEVSLSIVDSQNDTTEVYENISVSFTPGGSTRVVVTDLIEEGVIKVSSFIEGYLDGSNTAPFFLISTGKSVPNDTPLAMQLTVEVGMTVNISEEHEVPFFVGNK